MYHGLARVIMEGGGGGGHETKPCNAKEPQPTKSARVGQEPKAHFTQTS
jgi:hypothetical protein